VPPEQIADHLPAEWNSLERYDPGTTKLLHYTVVPTQPWKSDGNPLERLWVAQYAEAVAANAVPPDEVQEGIARGFLKPALAACLSLAADARPSAMTPTSMRALELEARALRGEVLMADARRADLEAKVRDLNRRISEIRGSWTWRIGRAATSPVVVVRRALERVREPRGVARPEPGAAVATHLPALYREMHAKGQFAGVAWRSAFESFTAMVPDLERRTILDFGCGPRGGLAEQLPGRVISYDPYVDAYAGSPWEQPFDVVFSSDVLEHLLQEDVETFASNVRRARPEFIFLHISTRSAHKTFSNGVNVHVTVQPASWWRHTLGRFWDAEYEARLLREDEETCTLFFQRRIMAVSA
jgi:hypothetical protein